MTDTLTPAEKNGSYTYSVTVKPYSMVTVSTVEHSQSDRAVTYELSGFEAKEHSVEVTVLSGTFAVD